MRHAFVIMYAQFPRICNYVCNNSPVLEVKQSILNVIFNSCSSDLVKTYFGDNRKQVFGFSRWYLYCATIPKNLGLVDPQTLKTPPVWEMPRPKHANDPM